LVGPVLVVGQAPWPDAPECAFIIELFMSAAWRGRGIARCCLGSGRGEAALRVAEGNCPARELYASCEFVSWP
jgi:hypothetical protein